MSGLITILVMSLLLGLGSFSFGMLPLLFVFSKSHLAKLSTFGTGLLLGAALGVIIPEGIETLAATHSSTKIPTVRVSLSLLIGFTFMFLVEQFTSHSDHSHSPSLPFTTNSPHIHFDIDLGELEREQGLGHAGDTRTSEALSSDRTVKIDGEGRRSERAYPLTFGLVIHSLADGLALGVSALGHTESDLSLVVFLALIIHKAPTALALTTSLLSTALPRLECKKHVAFFSAATPFGAVASYALFSFLEPSGENDWTGTALLVSGGTFLYVATVLQPVSHHSSGMPAAEHMTKLTRAALMIMGMFLPFAITALLGHGHGSVKNVSS